MNDLENLIKGLTLLAAHQPTLVYVTDAGPMTHPFLRVNTDHIESDEVTDQLYALGWWSTEDYTEWRWVS